MIVFFGLYLVYLIMTKLDIKDYEILQKGLLCLKEKGKLLDINKKEKLFKRIKEAEDALETIGIF